MVRIERIPDPANSYYHEDHAGSTMMMTGHDLAENEEYTYDAWGEHVDTGALPGRVVRR